MKLRRKKFQTVRYVLSEVIKIKVRYGLIRKWKQTMYPLGVKVEQRKSQIVKCYASRITEIKEIDNVYSTSIFWFKLVQVVSISVNFHQYLSIFILLKY